MADFGTEEGATCWRNGCQGVIKERPVENCSCHISPPCGACTTPREWCPECDWSAQEEERTFYFNELRCVAISREDARLGMYGSEPLKKFEPRPLDPKKLDYRIRSHTNSSQLCEGVYPETMTRSEVEAVVKGTFGGRFLQFGGGKFQYVAYTD